MTIEEFLTINPGQWLYNKKSAILCRANSGFSLTEEQKSAVELVKVRLDNTQNYTVTCRDHFSPEMWSQYGPVIHLEEREDWVKVFSINTQVDDQRIINRILYHQVQQLMEYITVNIQPSLNGIIDNLELIRNQAAPQLQMLPRPISTNLTDHEI